MSPGAAHVAASGFSVCGGFIVVPDRIAVLSAARSPYLKPSWNTLAWRTTNEAIKKAPATVAGAQ